MNRTLFGMDGAMGRWEAYRMIDEAEKGGILFRFVISPDPQQEDTEKDLFLREITEQTMLHLEDRVQREVQWVAAIHDDHAPHRHVHVVAVVPGGTLHQYDGDYSVPVPGGSQTVEVENTGVDWMYVGYTLRNGRAATRPALRVLALRSPDTA